MSSRAPAEREKLEALASMDLVKILRAYVLAVVDSAQGYKALVLDKDTKRIASTLCGRTELGEHGIVLIETLDASNLKDHQELKVRESKSLSREGLGDGKRTHLDPPPCGHAAMVPPACRGYE